MPWRGRHIMAGYWNRPETTAEAITDGWLHTGDIAVRGAGGFLYIQDRIKDMIISGGENVYPAEIEDVLLNHPGIADVAVLGTPSAKLARFKLPKRAVFTDVIPRSPTGKALKRLLREQFPLDAPE